MTMMLRCVQWCDADAKPATMPASTSHIASSLQSIAQQHQQQQLAVRPMNGQCQPDDDVVRSRHAAYGQSMFSINTVAIVVLLVGITENPVAPFQFAK